jgi:polar amino acid transport system permease protein
MLLRRSGSRIIADATRLFVEFIRGTPLLVQLYFLFYVLPDAGLLLPPLLAGVIGLGVHYSTYMSEVFRAGVENVHRSQWEAAKACNLTTAQTWRHVILPQAIPPMIPALANYLVAMFKETSLLSVITVVELMARARSVADTNFRYLEPMTLVGAFFLVISIVSVVIIRRLERRLVANSVAR